MANLNAEWCRALMEELRMGGAKFAVVCPGSRSTPLAIAAAETLRTYSIVDERSAAFFALGLAKGADAPAILICTSGTAGAHFLPAIIEAHLTRVPLVVITADRPPELHGWGALQSIDQQHLFGRYTSMFVDLGVPEPTEAAFRHLRATACRAVSTVGVVHLNAPFREPLAPTDEPGLVLPPSAARASRSFISVHAPASQPSTEALAEVARVAQSSSRGIILVGPRDRGDALPAALFRLAEHTGFPIVAESTSQCRWHPEARMVVSHIDAIIRHAPAAKALTPDVILKFGGPVTTKQVQAWIDQSGAHAVIFDELNDPNHSARTVVFGDPVVAAESLLTLVPRRGPTEFTRIALELDQRATVSPVEHPEELLRRVAGPGRTHLVVASSMPIRDLDAFGGSGPLDIRVHCNRGAAGIDGLPSTALGIAAATGQRTVLLTGDLTFFHDMNGLLAAKRYGIPLVVILINNDGGGIFSYLPVAQFREHFEELFGTPHGLDFSHAAAMYGARFHRPVDEKSFLAAIDEAREGLHIIEIRLDRASGPSEHKALWERAAAQMGAGPWH